MNRRPANSYAVLVALALLASGCAKDARVQWVQARRTVTHVEHQIREQTEAGAASEDAALLADPAVKAMRAAVDDGRARLREGNREGFRADMRMFWSIVARLAQDYTIPPLPPATQPVEQP